MAEPQELNLVRVRGDTFPIRFVLRDSAGVIVDVTGFSFTLTVDPAPDPVDGANNVLQLAGTLPGGGSDGAFEFSPNATEADIAPDAYFYDVQMTDAGGKIRTILNGTFTVEQDVTK